MALFSQSEKRPVVLVAATSVVEDRVSTGGQGLSFDDFDSQFYQNVSSKIRGTRIFLGSILKLDVSVGKYKRTVLIDEDSDVVEFNRRILSLIALLSKETDISFQRFQFLTLLIHHRFLLPQEYVAIMANGALDSERIQNVLDLSSEGGPQELASSKNRALKVESEKLFLFFERVFGSLDQSKNILRTSVAEINKNENRSKIAFWSSDNSWKEMTRLIAENQISTLNANLTGRSSQNTFVSLAKALEKSNERVTAIYLSSSLQNLLKAHTEDSASDQRKQLVKNLNFLPLAADCPVFFSLPLMSLNGVLEDLQSVTELLQLRVYFAMTKDHFMTSVLSVPTESLNGFRDYLSGLVKLQKSDLGTRPFITLLE